jgi:NTE family protein
VTRPHGARPPLEPPSTNHTNHGITLVLGGGGARGIAHLGVLRVLEEAKIPVAGIVGCSAGAVMGGTWLQSGSADRAIEQLLQFLGSPHFRRLGLSHSPMRRAAGTRPMLARLFSGWRRHVAMHLLFRRPSLFHRRRLELLVHAAIRPGSIEQLRLPLSVVALDLKTGEEVVLERGDLRQALTASSAVAGFFPPVEIDGTTLLDAGMADNLPVEIALSKRGRPIVAVNLNREVDERLDFPSGIEILLRSGELGSRVNNRRRAALADVQVAPRLGGRYWLDFSRPETILAAGEAAARESLDAIRRLLAPADARAE